MVFIQWDDSFSVNVQEIDLQHQRLVDMINTFYEYIQQDAKQALHELLDSLVQYTRYHFSTEEKYFEEFSVSFRQA